MVGRVSAFMRFDFVRGMFALSFAVVDNFEDECKQREDNQCIRRIHFSDSYGK